MLRLHLFGSTFLADEAGNPLGGAATQRRTLALLALLALAGETGLSRDKLVGLLWPESDAERARHSLTQALYAARRAVGIDDLFVVSGPDIRLAADRLGSDVGDFERRIQAGDLEGAVDLYEGSFLDGFFLAGSAEFDQWASMQRERLQSRAAESLDQLAALADERDDRARVLTWRRRGASLLPLDGRRAAQLMSALAESGDRAGALQHARLHATLLRQQLDLGPDPAVEALARDIRAASAAVVVPEEQAIDVPPVRPSDPPTHRSPRAALVVDDAAESVTVPAAGAIRVWDPPARARAFSSRFWTLAALSVVVVGVVLALRGALSSRAPVRPLDVRQRVVVAPFRVVGASPSLDYLREGIVELLSARLADDTAARSVDAGAVLGAWRAAGLTTSADMARGVVVDLAGRLGAERVVVGSVVGTPGRVVLSATVLQVPNGSVSAEASVAGPADSITALIDRLAARLLVSEAGQEASLAQHTSRSLPALHAFLAGQAAFRHGDFAGALQHYDRALARDTAFALAALYKAMAADRLQRPDALQAGIRAAWAARDELTAGDRTLLDALAGPRYPALTPAVELVEAWQQLVDRAPASADAWHALGVRMLHDGASAAIPDARARAVVMFQHALAIRPDDAGSRQSLAQLVGRLEPAAGDSAASPPALTAWRIAIMRADSAALRDVRASFARLGVDALRGIALASQYDAVGLGDGVAALASLRARGTRGASGTNGTSDARENAADLALTEHAFALNAGRAAAALEAGVRLRRAQPASDAWLRLRVLDALYGAGDSTAARDAARSLAALTRATPLDVPTTWDSWLANACVLGQWRLAHGDTTGIRAAIVAMRERPAIRSAALVRATPIACANLLEAALAVAARRADARARVSGVDSLAFTPQVAGDAASYAPLLIARLFERLGDDAAALVAVRKRTYLTVWPRYLAASWLQEGRLAERARDGMGARAAYQRFLSYRAPAGATRDALADDIRQRIVTLDSAR